MNINNSKILRLALGLIASISMMTHTGAATIVIDNFAEAHMAADSVADATPVISSLSAASALGGSREIISDKTGGTGGVVGVSDFGSTSVFSSSAAGSAVGTVTLRYDGIANDVSDEFLSGGTGIDLVDGTNDGIGFQIDFADAGGEINVVINDVDSTDFASVNYVVPGGGISNDIVFLPFSSFTVTGAGPIEDIVTTAGRVEIILDGTSTPGWDIIIEFIGSTPDPDAPVVPEPTRALLVLAGLLVGGLRRRR